MNLNDYTVLFDIQERLNELTADQFAAAERKLPPVNKKAKETLIGVVESRSTRALWVLMASLKAQEMVAVGKAHTETDEHLEKDSRQHAVRLDMLWDIVNEWFWVQAKMDCSFFEMDSSTIGLRAGWNLVKFPDRSGPQGLIAHLMSGGQGGPDDDK